MHVDCHKKMHVDSLASHVNMFTYILCYLSGISFLTKLGYAYVFGSYLFLPPCHVLHLVLSCRY
jgi:hypothetical protein